MLSCMPLISLPFEVETGRSGLGRPALGVSQMGETILTSQCLLIVFFLYAHCSIESGCSEFSFSVCHVLSCGPSSGYPYPRFITFCLYRFLSVIHGWVCWVSWSCKFVILIWNSFTIIGPGHCPVCPPLEDSSFIHVVWSDPQLVHVPFLVFFLHIILCGSVSISPSLCLCNV